MMKNQVFNFYEAIGEDGQKNSEIFQLYFPEKYLFWELDYETKADFIAENPGPNQALLIAMHLGVAFASERRPILLSARHSNMVGAFAKEKLGTLKQEQLFLALLNTQLDVIGWEVVFVGTLTEVAASPREIFQRALLANAYAIIIAHNHPSGNLRPSVQDKQFTRRLYHLGQDLNLPLLDAFIVTKDGYWSMQENGQLLGGEVDEATDFV
ncbi:JAB domain-containing protein [Fructobacillus evanidus]|uniref:Contains a helix-hairpin-helix DNA-binding motif (RadC) n=1 Tax=Fructobacillus evanidus TaxID=3064281 RepID=A0ABN9YSE9_9LACO|nr:DNA repair protein RadC [Fructobacillus sp. LMG 32999]CAK1236712.1 DNA repair protein RadC [Fructobacillus sp. LMG 32999]CAK1242192.1 DNA repair protein RadC [Fructobacillus sp. LMG 32999]CAK1244186.1 DNA repair protein RadC [Fructobacillus sp. LMG 32999]CAK1246962.1 DNA repair protein RadC [Fructobacillus sp. LMG 32999]